MDNNHVFKYISEQELGGMLNAFHAITRLNISLIDENGRELLQYGEKYPYCMEFARHNKSGRNCAQEHVRAGEMARDFGEAYVFCCHSGMNHIVYPIMIKGKQFGSAVAGPFLMDEPDSALVTDLSKEKAIPAEGLVRLMNYSSGIPVIDPDLVNQISVIFNYLMRSILVESRQVIAANKGKLLQQSRINESIQLYKNSGFREEKMYPVELENELISCIKVNNTERARELLNELLGHILLYEGHDTDHIKIRIIELCSLLSRASINRGADVNMVLGMNQRLITALAASKNIYDICYTFQDNIEIFTDNLFLTQEKNSRIVKNAVEYIARHFSEEISLASVADTLHVNTSYLSTLFRQVTGTTFKEYLNRIRIEEAARLLSNTDYPVMEIAIACGYKDQSYFTKVFKKLTGLTPRQYRQ
jgi:AraC-like DNA-binding protein/ligand-binding sensor protein